jgi:hypothetical protein
MVTYKTMNPTQPITVVCPVCSVQPDQPCDLPSTLGIGWNAPRVGGFHLSRIEAVRNV